MNQIIGKNKKTKSSKRTKDFKKKMDKASKDNKAKAEHTCCICGRLIKKISPRTKYCAKCAKEVHKEQDKLYRQNKRKD